MAKISYVQNGVKKTRGKKRRSNGVAKRTATNGVKRRTVSLASAKSVLKRNGLKAVSLKAVANGRKKKRRSKRRNGLATARGYSITRSNGLLGKTKQDAKVVGAVLGGAAFTKIVGRVVAPFVSPYMAKVGAGQFTELVVDTAIALTVVPFAARKVGGSAAETHARIGGLLVVALDAVEQVAPNLLTYNPFNMNPVVLANGAPALTPKAVAALVDATSAAPAEKAAVAGAMQQLASGAGNSAGVSSFNVPSSGGQIASQLPLMNE